MLKQSSTVSILSTLFLGLRDHVCVGRYQFTVRSTTTQRLITKRGTVLQRITHNTAGPWRQVVICPICYQGAALGKVLFFSFPDVLLFIAHVV